MSESLRAFLRSRWSWLAVGSAVLVVSNGRWIVAAAAWLALSAWLVFIDRSPRLPHVAAGAAVWLGVFFVSWWGIVPAPGLLYFLITGVYAAVYFVPFLVHRFLTRGLSGITATLVFPLAWVSIEMLFQRWGTPYGSWLSWAYTQSGMLTLSQIASVTGAAGIGFVIAWTASLFATSLREQTFADRSRALGLMALVLVVPLAYGQVRLMKAGTTGGAERMALLVPSEELLEDLDEAMSSVLSSRARVDEDRLGQIIAIARRINEDLFERTRREARAGAKLVAWSETAGRVLVFHERDMLEQGQRIAAAERTTLILAYGVWDPTGRPPLRNRVAAIDYEGRLAWTYDKTHPIVGPESPLVDPGEGRIRALDTPVGRIGAVICHDLDFPQLLRKAARERIEIVIGPSFDWHAITDLHADMAALRSIESGFTLVRPTFNGRTIVTDPYGRELASDAHPSDATVVNVPPRRVATAFGRLGDAFAWGNLLGLSVLTVIAVGRRRRFNAGSP